MKIYNMKVLLTGPIFTQSGYGEHTRLVYNVLNSIPGLYIHVSPLMWGNTTWNITDSDADPVLQKQILVCENYLRECADKKVSPQYDFNIHVGIPNECKKAAPHTICVTAGIETDRVAPPWLVKTHSEIDKLIVPSEHAKSGFVNTTYEILNETKGIKTLIGCNCPVDVVPYPVKEIIAEDIDIALETEFNFLSVALLGHRKNIENSIMWFINEFKEDPNVGLIIKTGKSRGSNMDFLRTKKHLEAVIRSCGKKKCKIYLLHGNMTEQQVHSLYNRSDIHCYVSTTCGEGYGLPLFEAAYSGLPIVATDWSGHLDFLTASISDKKTKKVKKQKLFSKVEYSLAPIPEEAVWEDILIEGSLWAHPKESSFRQKIRNIRKNYVHHKKRAKILQEQLLISHKKEKIEKQMRDSILDFLGTAVEDLYGDQEWISELSEIKPL